MAAFSEGGMVANFGLIPLDRGMGHNRNKNDDNVPMIFLMIVTMVVTIKVICIHLYVEVDRLHFLQGIMIMIKLSITYVYI